MKVLFDTNVFVAAVVEIHEFHERARPWLDKALAGELEFLISTHSLAEIYSALTNLPLKPRISPGEARSLIRENVQGRAVLVPLAASDYDVALDRMARMGIVGGAVYDALIARAAEKAGANVLLTFNSSHFLRVWPEGSKVVREP